MCDTGQCSAALEVLEKLLGSADWKFAERRVVAELQLLTARLY